MVEIKVDNQEILFRVVLSGHQNSTKFATVRELHDGLQSSGVDNLTVIHAGGDKIVGFRWPLQPEDNLFGMKVMIDVLARPGELKTSANDVLIYRSSDAIIYLDDREPATNDVTGHFQAFLGQLDSLSRKPEELPLLVQTYEDAESDRARIYTMNGSQWQPEIHVRGPANESVVEVLHAAKARVLTNYRTYESELNQKGLQGHIKIRDRVYECVPVEPHIAPTEANTPGDVRLISADVRGGLIPGRTFRMWIWLALAVTVLAAVLVSLSI